MMMVKEQVDYKKAYKEALASYEDEYSLTSQVMSISTEQIRIGRDLIKIAEMVNEGDHLRSEIDSAMSLVEKGYKYVEEMKYDFVVGYCDELWRELRKGLWQLEDSDIQNDEVRALVQAVNTIRWQMVALKDFLREGERWDDKAIGSFEKLKEMLSGYDEAMEQCTSVIVEQAMLISYMELAEFFIDGFFVGLQLRLRIQEVSMLMTKV